MTSTYLDQLSAALVERENAVPETAAVLAKIVIDSANGGPVIEAIDLARSAYPNMFVSKTPAPATAAAPEAETVTARVARLHREAEARGDDPATHMPVTHRVLREARGG